MKTSKGKKNVILLSTAPPILGITKHDGKSKLRIYKVYDFTKGRTDIIDQRWGQQRGFTLVNQNLENGQ